MRRVLLALRRCDKQPTNLCCVARAAHEFRRLSAGTPPAPDAPDASSAAPLDGAGEARQADSEACTPAATSLLHDALARHCSFTLEAVKQARVKPLLSPALL